MSSAAPQLRRAALAGLALLLVLAYLRPLLFGDTFALRDHLLITLPSRAALAGALQSFELLEWWDGVGLGVNFAGNPLHGVAYPPAWIVGLLPMPWAADVLSIAHVGLLAAGTALLSSRLGAHGWGAFTAGAAAMLAGYTGSMVINGVPILTMAWTPWVLWACDRLAKSGAATRNQVLSGGLLVAALIAAQIASGDPAGVITSGLAALSWVAVRAEERRLRALALVAAAHLVAVALAGATVLPALHQLGDSTRAGGLPLEVAGGWSMHPWRILEWLAPGGLGDPADARAYLGGVIASSSPGTGQAAGWSHSLFIGLPVLLLAAASATRRDCRWLLIASLIFVILALGTYTPIYGVFRAVVLPERVVRYPERHLFGALVMWCALAGVGLRQLRTVRWPALAAAALGLLAALLLHLWTPSLPERLDPALTVAAIRGGVLTAALSTAALALMAFVSRANAARRLAAPVAAAAAIAPLLGHHWSATVLIDRDLIDSRPALLGNIPPSPDPGPRPRLYHHRSLQPRGAFATPEQQAAALHDIAVANVGTRFGITYAPGYDPALSQRMRQTWEENAEHGLELLALYGVEYLVTPVPPPPSWRVVGVAHGLALIRRPGPRPPAFVATPRAAEGPLFGDAFAPERPRVEPGASLAELASPISPCRIVSWQPDRQELRCTASGRAVAVVMGAWAPGWTATVDGRSAEVRRADRILRAVAIGPGEHRIVMQFSSPGLRAGAAVSGLSWLAWLGTWLAIRRLRRRRSGSPV